MARADLHIHTTVSDVMFSPQRLVEEVERAGELAVIAVTDHEDAAGGHRAREAAARRSLALEVVVGAEITTRQGHLLALFIDRAPPPFRSVESTLEAIAAQGGLAVVPHPMSWLTRSLGARTIARIQDRSAGEPRFDAIELCNPSPAGLVARTRAIAANAAWGLPAIGSSDAHHIACIGRGWTEFEGASAEELRSAILAGATRPRMRRYPSLREVGVAATALGLAWGYAATPRKVVRRLAGGGRPL